MKTEMVTMTLKESRRAVVIQQVEDERKTVPQAAQELQLSIRQIRRLIMAYRLKGAAGLVHGNRGKVSPHHLDSEVEQRIIALIKKQYRDYNTLHLCQELQEQFDIRISYASLYRLRQQAHLASPRTRRAPRHRLRRMPEPLAGDMLQADGSDHTWLEDRGPRLTLIAYIDDATSEVVGATFREEEDTTGYMLALREICQTHGLPLAVYADRHTIFQSPAKATIEQTLAGKTPMSQYERALSELGIRLIAAHSPQAKGRVERLFQTLQDRLVKFLRTKQACTCEQANRLLPLYLKQHNARFSHPARGLDSSYRAWPASLDPEAVFCLQYQRTVANDNTITFDGHVLQIPPGPARRSFAHAHVDVRLHLDGHLSIHYKGAQIASFQPADDTSVRANSFTPKPTLFSTEPTSPEVPEIPKPVVVRPATKPAANHPWRRMPITVPKE
jgi:transposase